MMRSTWIDCYLKDISSLKTDLFKNQVIYNNSATLLSEIKSPEETVVVLQSLVFEGSGLALASSLFVFQINGPGFSLNLFHRFGLLFRFTLQ